MHITAEVVTGSLLVQGVPAGLEKPRHYLQVGRMRLAGPIPCMSQSGMGGAGGGAGGLGGGPDTIQEAVGCE